MHACMHDAQHHVRMHTRAGQAACVGIDNARAGSSLSPCMLVMHGLALHRPTPTRSRH